MKLWVYSSVALYALALGATGQGMPGTNLTAFALVKVGDKFVSPKAKDQITQIHSERSAGSLIPDIWYVDYFDPTTAFKTTEVKFIAGKMAEIRQPKHVLDAFSGTKKLRWKNMKVDSDRALAMALQQPMLKGLILQSAQYWLERTAAGSTWRIRFWTSRPGKPAQVDDIGELYISSKNGEILKNELHF